MAMYDLKAEVVDGKAEEDGKAVVDNNEGSAYAKDEDNDAEAEAKEAGILFWRGNDRF